MATVTVRNLEDDIVRRLRIRAEEHGRSAEAEHREILRTALLDSGRTVEEREQAVAQFAEFRRQIGGREGPTVAELLEESRNERMEQLTRHGDAD